MKVFFAQKRKYFREISMTFREFQQRAYWVTQTQCNDAFESKTILRQLLEHIEN